MAGTRAIPFNPDLMSVKQAKECAELLHTVEDMVARGSDPKSIVGLLNESLTLMQAKYEHKA